LIFQTLTFYKKSTCQQQSFFRLLIFVGIGMMAAAPATMSSQQQQQQPMSLLPLTMPFRQLCMIFLVLVLLLAAPAPASCSGSSTSSSSTSLILRVRLPDGSMQRVSVPSDQATLRDVVTSVRESLSEDGDTTTCSWEENDDNDGDKESMPMVEINGKYIPISSSTTSNNGDDNDKSNEEYTVRTVRDWGLRQGSILTIIPSAAERKKTLTSLPPSSFDTEQKQTRHERWDPFPDLATDYAAALLKTKRRRARGASLSYADLAQLQASMHVVEAQPTGPIARVYMCATSAERFQINSSSSSSGGGGKNRVGLLLGTVQRERTNPQRKARTSLSSTTEAEEHCQVVKVHAIWEPPTTTPTTSTATAATAYDATPLFNLYQQQQQDQEAARVLRVAQWLGLQPVGWIYSYNDNRMKQHQPQQKTAGAAAGSDGTAISSSTEDALPVWIRDVATGAKLQIYNMQSSLPFGGRVDGSRFVTLAMDAQMGATEAFQLSDVAVQMVAEDMVLLDQNDDDDDEKKKDGKNSKKTTKASGGGGRYGSTRHPILVDGKETHTLDSVLCLVNTAMLSHQGSFVGTTKTSSSAVKKSNGRLTTKTRKALLKALDGQDYASLFGILSNFQVLLAIDEALLQKAGGNVNSTTSEQLVTLVRKWARGQKQGTVLDAKLEKALRALLEH
jgi:NPL4 family